jgi:hypothetical protein
MLLTFFSIGYNVVVEKAVGLLSFVDFQLLIMCCGLIQSTGLYLLGSLQVTKVVISLIRDF